MYIINKKNRKFFFVQFEKKLRFVKYRIFIFKEYNIWIVYKYKNGLQKRFNSKVELYENVVVLNVD